CWSRRRCSIGSLTSACTPDMKARPWSRLYLSSSVTVSRALRMCSGRGAFIVVRLRGCAGGGDLPAWRAARAARRDSPRGHDDCKVYARGRDRCLRSLPSKPAGLKGSFLEYAFMESIDKFDLAILQ